MQNDQQSLDEINKTTKQLFELWNASGINKSNYHRHLARHQIVNNISKGAPPGIALQTLQQANFTRGNTEKIYIELLSGETATFETPNADRTMRPTRLKPAHEVQGLLIKTVV